MKAINLLKIPEPSTITVALYDKLHKQIFEGTMTSTLQYPIKEWTKDLNEHFFPNMI